MKVEKIKLIGFKSFAQELEIDFSSRVTTIIGPNGCGKSNILDAFRWVLGQKSAYSLRGKVMDDFIFFGSSTQGKSRFAEVRLYLDNRSRMLDIEFEKVIIARRLYLAAGSEYYVNDRRINRQDIEKMMKPTGISQSSYAFIGQGKISELLTASGEDRRRLIEEAAEVIIPKKEKADALLRLEETNLNISRTSDILIEKEKELSKLQEMAHQTRQYQRLHKQYDEIDLAVRYLLWQKLKKYQRDRIDKLHEVEKRNENTIDQDQSLLRSIAEYEQEVDKINQRIQSIQSAYQGDLQLMAAESHTIETFQSKTERIDAKVKIVSKQLKSEENTYRMLKKQTAELHQMRFNLSSKIEDITKTLESKQQGKIKIENLLNLTVETAKKLEKQREELSQQQDSYYKKIKYLNENLLKQIENIKKSVGDITDDWKRERETLLVTLDEVQIKMEKMEQAFSQREYIEARKIFSTYSFNDFLRINRQYIKRSEDILSLFFGSDGLFSQSDDLAKDLQSCQMKQEQISQKIEKSGLEQKELQKRIKKINGEIDELTFETKTNQINQTNTELNTEKYDREIKSVEKRVSYFTQELNEYELASQKNQNEIKEYRIALEASQLESKKRNAQIKELNQQMQERNHQIKGIQRVREENRNKNTANLLERQKLTLEIEKSMEELTELEQNLFNDHQIKVEEISISPRHQMTNSEKLKKKLFSIKEDLKAKGFVNLQAEDELKKAEEAVADMEKQKRDIEMARSNILRLISELDEKTLLLFDRTLKKVERKFEEMIDQLFNGGRASLQLFDQSNRLTSGIDIRIQPAGKKNSTISVLSGGEQTLGALAFLFALYLIKPSPVCFLDEVDANLDEANIPRFLKLIEELSQNTQFIMISHSKLTIAQSDLIIGITQENPGISSVTGLKPQMILTKD